MLYITKEDTFCVIYADHVNATKLVSNSMLQKFFTLLVTANAKSKSQKGRNDERALEISCYRSGFR